MVAEETKSRWLSDLGYSEMWMEGRDKSNDDPCLGCVPGQKVAYSEMERGW